MSETAREHHFEMKNLLARMALQNVERFFTTFGPGGDSAYLVDLWTGVGRSLEAPIDAAGLGAELRAPTAEVKVLLITLPPPDAPNEAYFVAATRDTKGQTRVFGLERLARSAETVLVEFTALGRTVWSREPVLGSAGFEARMLEIIAQIDAVPLVMTSSVVPQ